MEQFREALDTNKIKVKAKKGDYVAIWTTLNYDPNVQIIKADDFDNFFNENNGYDEDVIKEIANLKSGAKINPDGDKGHIVIKF